MKKRNLILLHAALGSESQLLPLKSKLESTFNVYSFDFLGHGHAQNTDVFSIDVFVKQLHDFIEANQLEETALFGYSMGGYVALKYAQKAPEKISHVVTLGTKFSWTPEIASAETAQLNPVKIREKVPAFADKLHQMHGENWEHVVLKTADMMLQMGAGKTLLTREDWNSIRTNTLLLLAEKDAMVTVSETEYVKSQLRNATFGILENAKHPIESVDLEALTEMLEAFIEN